MSQFPSKPSRLRQSSPSQNQHRPRSGTRRRLLAWPAAAIAASTLGGMARAQYTVSNAAPRVALLLGNRIYPAPFDLPPVHKNVRDMDEALTQRGFDVTSGLDLSTSAQAEAIQAFAAKVATLSPDATVLFYFTGHGLQLDAENLLVPAGTSPSSQAPVLQGSSLHLARDVVGRLPNRPNGLTMAVVDACRTSLKATLESMDGFNQVEAPAGCLIAFSTGAGKPAIAPAVETLSTFYTASLVKLLKSSSDEITFSDLFRLVKLDVQQTMLHHPVAAIRQVAQYPFIAENTKVRVTLAVRSREAPPAATRFSSEDESADWQKLEQTLWPADVVKLAEEYLRRYPDSRLAASAQVSREGAAEASQVLRRNDVRLYRGAWQPKPDAEPLLNPELYKAARGDKDAAARIGRLYARGEGPIAPDPNRYEGWLQYAAALGNGIASYELALHYRRSSQPVQAAQFEARAKELGYTPPPSLDNTRK